VDNINMDRVGIGWEVDGTGSGSCPVAVVDLRAMQLAAPKCGEWLYQFHNFMSYALWEPHSAGTNTTWVTWVALVMW